MKNLLVFLFIAVSLFLGQFKGQAQAAGQCSDRFMVFYQAPTYADFIQLTSSAIEKRDDFIFYDFATLVLKQHPNYADQVVSSFSTYSALEKNLLYRSLIASGNTPAAEQIHRKYGYTGFGAPSHSVEEIESLQINDDPAKLDQAWAAFAATGEKKYLDKIMNYINADRELLAIALELENRDQTNTFLKELGKNTDGVTPSVSTGDLTAHLRKRYGKHWKIKLKKVAVIKSGVWSLKSIEKCDAQVQIYHHQAKASHQNWLF